jgi:hypothetical protein
MLRYTTYSNVPQFIQTVSVDSSAIYTVFSSRYTALLGSQNQYKDKNVYKSPQEREIKRIYTDRVYKNYKCCCLNRVHDISIYPSEIVCSILGFQNQAEEFGSRGVK